ncbi:ABC transporter ATP-binding protein [Sphingomonas adhaesiva]|uniref:ABC transporter ATP-binding protein n=1 Tax=Sphingomonas adhaesiva TaxID=28212 RepID=UPI002FFB5451
MTHPQTLAVEAAGLVKRYGTRRVVDGVDLSVPTGAIYGVLGPNGAGKTTTLRMMLGIIEPDEGTRTLLGADHPRDASDRVGYLPEERGLYPAMKAREAIAFMAALRGLDWRTGRARAGELLEAAGLAHAADQKIRKLSKGMAQLVQLLGSVVHRPDLLVLDEPFSGLDPVNQERLEALILAERDRGATILFSTHVMAHAQRLCDRLAIIAGGRRRFEGTVDEARGHLPQQVHYVPHHPDAAIAALLPPDAQAEGDGWRFQLPAEGVEGLLTRLIDAGHGISGLSIERPGLHEAFVRIVGEAASDDRHPGREGSRLVPAAGEEAGPRVGPGVTGEGR